MNDSAVIVPRQKNKPVRRTVRTTVITIVAIRTGFPFQRRSRVVAGIVVSIARIINNTVVKTKASIRVQTVTILIHHVITRMIRSSFVVGKVRVSRRLNVRPPPPPNLSVISTYQGMAVFYARILTNKGVVGSRLVVRVHMVVRNKEYGVAGRDRVTDAGEGDVHFGIRLVCYLGEGTGLSTNAYMDDRRRRGRRRGRRRRRRGGRGRRRR